jgi:hypothetical protein
MVCDCGGGTVDITTYSMVEIEPRFEFKELLVGLGEHHSAIPDRSNSHTNVAQAVNAARQQSIAICIGSCTTASEQHSMRSRCAEKVQVVDS